jgi:hypothetical protein
LENINPTKANNHLYLEAEPEAIRAMVFVKGQASLAEYVEFSGGLNASLLGTHKLFRQPYESVKISLQTHRFSLVPEAFFQKDKVEQIAKASFLFDEEKEELLVSHIKPLGVAVVSVAEKALLNEIKSKFPYASVYHSSYPFLSTVYRAGQPLTIHLQCTDKTLEFAIIENERILFYNQFPVHTAEDAVYHLLNVCKTLNIERQAAELLFYFGNVHSELKDWLQKFFPKMVCTEEKQGFKQPTYSIFRLDKCE